MTWLALDIGGANLKAADGAGFVLARSFPLWQRPRELVSQLEGVLSESPATSRLAVTMTGELADCFNTKREGVTAIIGAVAQAARERAVWIYLTDGSLVPWQQAVVRPLEAAASNWHALASFAARYAAGPSALLVDIGSTTSDLVPLSHGRPAAGGRTDPERLALGELVYTGVTRSPVCAVSPRLPWRGEQLPTAQELFATTWDAYLMLGELPEEPASLHTADGRPATRPAARDRLARSICADRELFNEYDARKAALQVALDQLDLLAAAAARLVRRMHAPPTTAVLSGQGEFLARQLVARLDPACSVVSLGQALGADVSRCATAHALAVLAREMHHWDAKGAYRPCPIRPAASPPPLRVIKLGGSLLRLSDVSGRLIQWLADQPPASNVLIVGGGHLADAVRQANRAGVLSELDSHWLAVRAMAVNARGIQRALSGPCHARSVQSVLSLDGSQAGALLVLDPYQWLQHEEPGRGGRILPIGWAVTSDSIAARCAQVMAADELVLLKSALPESALSKSALSKSSMSESARRATAAQAARDGYVDEYFPTAAAGLKSIRCVDLRQPGFPAACLHA